MRIHLCNIAGKADGFRHLGRCFAAGARVHHGHCDADGGGRKKEIPSLTALRRIESCGEIAVRARGMGWIERGGFRRQDVTPCACELRPEQKGDRAQAIHPNTLPGFEALRWTLSSAIGHRMPSLTATTLTRDAAAAYS